jgi:hypothetical protein
MALIAAGSHYLTNFDADSAHEAARRRLVEYDAAPEGVP